MLRDPNSRCNRWRQLSLATVGTSGHFINKSTYTSLLACVKIISEGDFGSSVKRCLGSGRFGVCYLRTLGHFSVCEKVLKHTNNDALMQEANLLSKFCHRCLPYLFGVRIDDHPSIITSFHGLNDHSVTIHRALFTQSQEVRRLLINIDWIHVLSEITCGLEYLHNRHKLLHNDLKADNVVLTPIPPAGSIGPVIIDFGKACEISKSRVYHLSQRQREQYKVNHPHIAPDLRDGKCSQSISSDIFSVGRIINLINDTTASLQHKSLQELSQKCM